MGDNFRVNERNHLTLHGLDMLELCHEYGTPLFVFDENSIADNFERFKKAFVSCYPTSMVCYSIKTNSNLAICKILQSKGAFAEVSSELDLEAAFNAGFSGDHTIFDGLYKSEKTLRTALKAGVLLVNVESLTETERINNIAKELGIVQAVGVRLAPGKHRNIFAAILPENLYDAAQSYPESKFGLPMEDGFRLFEKSSRFPNLRFEGLMIHPYVSAVRTLLPFMHEVHRRLGVNIKYLNVGGGFYPRTTAYLSYRRVLADMLKQKLGLKSSLDSKRSRTPEVELLAEQITGAIRNRLGGLPEPVLIVEPGRYVAGPAGILLLNVDHTKMVEKNRWVIVNGGINILPIAGIATRRKIIVANKAAEPSSELVNIAGPSLNVYDNVALKTWLPKVEEGDTLAVFDCGAYTLSVSNQFLYPRPAAVLLNSQKEIKVIRESETCEDVLRKDRL